ncbi:MAG: SCO family protein [Solirubrobacterales bacterium]|nr:SCO family protein [Solirubrobacterales bacterium]
MRALTRTALALLTGLLALALILVILLHSSGNGAGSATSPTAPASRFGGAALPPGSPAPDFTLVDQDGRPVSLSQTRGEVTVLSFLYSGCGAACVVIAQQIRGALDQLRRPARVLILSADPRADTPARMGRFLTQQSLSGRASYLSGSLAQLRPIWRAFGVTPASAGRVAFDRTATVTLLDPQRRRRVLFGSEQLTPEALAHDIGRLDGEPTHP